MDLQLSKLSLLLNKTIFPEKHIHQRMPRRHGNQYPRVPTFLHVINLGGSFFWDTLYNTQVLYIIYFISIWKKNKLIHLNKLNKQVKQVNSIL